MPKETWTIEMRGYSGSGFGSKTFRVTANSPKAARDTVRRKLGKDAPDYYVADQRKA